MSLSSYSLHSPSVDHLVSPPSSSMNDVSHKTGGYLYFHWLKSQLEARTIEQHPGEGLSMDGRNAAATSPSVTASDGAAKGLGSSPCPAQPHLPNLPNILALFGMSIKHGKNFQHDDELTLETLLISLYLIPTKKHKHKSHTPTFSSMATYQGVWRKAQLVPCWILQWLAAIIFSVFAIIVLAYMDRYRGAFSNGTFSRARGYPDSVRLVHPPESRYFPRVYV